MSHLPVSISRVFIGTIIHVNTPSTLEILVPGVLGVSHDGKIAFVDKIPRVDGKTREESIDDEVTLRAALSPSSEIIRVPAHGFLFPGLIDTHNHAPQYVFTGTGYDKDLLGWLATYTFPRESEFKNEEYAEKVYNLVVSRLIRSGTTTACYYGTIHVPACVALAKVMLEKGQRGFVGKVCMDRNAPDFYVEKTGESLSTAREIIPLIKHLPGNSAGLVSSVVTPRFAPACTPELLFGLGTLADEQKLLIQTHISESRGEIDWVTSLFPEYSSYADVYLKHNLLNNRTVLAHAIHLTPDERQLVKGSNAGISHCPTSNFCLTSGILNIRLLLEEGITKIGLGTDVSGGYSPSMLTSVRDALTASKILAFPQPNTVHNTNPAKNQQALTLPEALYLATLGGARVLNLESRIGNFEVGKDFDAILVDPEAGGIDFFDHDDTAEYLEKWVYLGDDRCTQQVFVKGNRIYSSHESMVDK